MDAPNAVEIEHSSALKLPFFGLSTRPVVILAPDSLLGWTYAPAVIKECRNIVSVVDNNSSKPEIHGIPRWGFEHLRANVSRIPDLIGIDFSTSAFGFALFGRLATEIGLPTVDFVQALAEFDLVTVYQKFSAMRDGALARHADYGALRSSLGDNLSKLTLDAFLDLRVNGRRDRLRDVLVSHEDEYFTTGNSDLTFRLLDNEAFCDAGAYVGQVIQKVIAATGGKFDVIHAFEPDHKTFTDLCKLATLPFDNIHFHRKAVGEYTGRAQFWQTGTMGSHVLLNGEASEHTVPITRIDDAMDRVTFIKMDLEGFEARALRGASDLIRKFRPRMAITAYHYVDDLLDICETINDLMPDNVIRLRQHHLSFYDTIVYAQPA